MTLDSPASLFHWGGLREGILARARGKKRSHAAPNVQATLPNSASVGFLGGGEREMRWRAYYNDPLGFDRAARDASTQESQKNDRTASSTGWTERLRGRRSSGRSSLATDAAC